MKRFSFSFLALLLCLSGAQTALADSEGPKSPGTAAHDTTTGNHAWDNTSGVFASDDNRASAFTGLTSYYLAATNFNFSLPSNVSIDGIEAAVELSASCGNAYRSNAVQLIQDGVVTGSDLKSGAYWPITDTVVTHGSPTETWGLTWTPSQINSTDFGVGVSVGQFDGLQACDAYIDHITITVYYTATATETSLTRGAARARLLRRRSNPTFSDTKAPSLSEVGIFVPKLKDGQEPEEPEESEEHPSAAAGESSEPPILLEEEVCTRFEQYRAHDSVWERLMKRLNKWFGGECP